MRAKAILILYGGDDWSQNVPQFSDSQRFAYSTWGEICHQKNTDLIRASIAWFDGEKFTKSWKYSGDDTWEKISQPIRPDVVYDKMKIYNPHTGEKDYNKLAHKQDISRRFPVKNHPFLTELIENKSYQASLFHSSLPYSTFIDGSTTIPNSKHQTWVIKKPYGSGGKSVWTTSKPHITVEDALLQEFVDLRKRDERVKDIRCIFLGESLQYVFSRIAQPDSIYTNFHQGASIEFLNPQTVNHIIEDGRNILKPINDVFPDSLIAIDFLTNSDFSNYLLIEANSMPGVDTLYDAPSYITKDFMNNLTEWLLSK